MEKTVSEPSFFQTILEKIPSFLGAFAILIIFWILGNIIKKAVLRQLGSRNIEDHTSIFLSNLAHIGMLAIGFTTALKVIGIDVIALVGLFGFGMGMAVKDLMKNFIAGIMIFIQEPFKIGDVIKVQDYIGKVENIENRATYIKNFDGQEIIIPNADIYNNSITNLSTFSERRMSINVKLDYKTNLALAAKTLFTLLQNNPKIMKTPPPQIFFEEFADSSINLSVKFWMDSKKANILKVKSDLIPEIKKAFDDAGIKIPFPVRTLQFDKG